MKNIDDFIRDKRCLFDDREPIEGHMERFEWKLEKRLHSQRNKRSIVPYLLKAAAVTIMITLSSLWIWDNFIRSGKERMALGDVSPQYREVENYYVHQVSSIEGELKNSYLKDDPEQKMMLEKELRTMDSVYLQLQKDLKANPNDERIINAMIQHYQTKVDVLSYILNQLKSLKNEPEKKQYNGKADI